MTFKQKAERMLYERGMFKEQAAEVVTRLMADPANEAMQGRWDDHVEGYPPVMLNVLWVSLKRVALYYIEEKCPAAWFKALFESEGAKVTD